MNNTIELPVIMPRFTSFHFLGSAGIVINTVPRTDTWYINNCVQWQCERNFMKGHTSLELNVCMGHYMQMPFIEKQCFPKKYIINCFKEVTTELLRDGYYVVFNGVDDYYVEGKGWYNTKHFSHDGLITGINNDNDTFSVVAYNNRWIYKKFDTPVSGIINGLHSPYAKTNDEMLIGLRIPNTCEIELDLNLLYSNFKDYLFCTFEKYPLDGEGPIYGIAAYNYIDLYLQYLIEGKLPIDRMDRRLFRMILEHKKCMLDRIIAVEKALNIQPEISDCYRPLVELCTTLFTKYTKCRLQSNTIEQLKTLQPEIKYLEEKEIELISEIIKKLF